MTMIRDEILEIHSDTESEDLGTEVSSITSSEEGSRLNLDENLEIEELHHALDDFRTIRTASFGDEDTGQFSDSEDGDEGRILVLADQDQDPWAGMDADVHDDADYEDDMIEWDDDIGPGGIDFGVSKWEIGVGHEGRFNLAKLGDELPDVKEFKDISPSKLPAAPPPAQTGVK